MESAKKEFKLILTLTKEEAVWLKAYLQNSKVPLDKESKEDTEMRRRFWEEFKINGI